MMKSVRNLFAEKCEESVFRLLILLGNSRK